MFTINRLGLPLRLRRCLGSTPDRQHPSGREAEDPQGDELEERRDGLEVGCRFVR